MTKPDRSYKVMSVGELIPMSFGPDSLQEERVLHKRAAQKVQQEEEGAWGSDSCSSSRASSESSLETETITN